MPKLKQATPLTREQMRKALADHQDRVGNFSIRYKEPGSGKWHWHVLSTIFLLESLDRQLSARSLGFLEERLRGRRGMREDAEFFLMEVSKLKQEASRAARSPYWFKKLTASQRREALIDELSDWEAQGRAVKSHHDSFPISGIISQIRQGEFSEGTLLHLGDYLFSGVNSSNAKLAHEELSRLVPPLPKTNAKLAHEELSRLVLPLPKTKAIRSSDFQNALPLADGQPAES